MSNTYFREMPFYRVLYEKGTMAIAHRGGNGANTYDNFEEFRDGWVIDKQNSMAAFQSAYDMGYRYGETDAVVSADDVVMAFHGSRNEKEKAKTGLPTRDEIQTMTYAEIQADVRIGREKMPAMAELLMEFPDMRFFIDPKTPEVVEPLGRMIKKHRAHHRVSIGAFSYERTKGVLEHAGDGEKIATTVGPMGSIALLAAVHHMPGARRYLWKSGITGFALPHQHVSAKEVEVAHELQMPLTVWTPNDRKEIEQALNIGVDGVMSDDTTSLMDIIRRHNLTDSTK